MLYNYGEQRSCKNLELGESVDLECHNEWAYEARGQGSRSRSLCCTFGRLAFSVAGVTFWNSLPDHFPASKMTLWVSGGALNSTHSLDRLHNPALGSWQWQFYWKLLKMELFTSAVAPWLGRRSLTGRLFLIYTWSVVDMCPLWIYQPGQLSLPSLWVGKWVVIHVKEKRTFTFILGTVDKICCMILCDIKLLLILMSIQRRYTF